MAQKKTSSSSHAKRAGGGVRRPMPAVYDKINSIERACKKARVAVANAVKTLRTLRVTGVLGEDDLRQLVQQLVEGLD